MKSENYNSSFEMYIKVILSDKTLFLVIEASGLKQMPLLLLIFR